MLLQHRSQFSQPEPGTRRWPDQQLSSVGQELLRINNLFRSPFHLVTTSEARKAVPRGAISTSAQTCFLPGQSVIVGWKLRKSKPGFLSWPHLCSVCVAIPPSDLQRAAFVRSAQKRPECAPCAKGCELRTCGLHQFWKKWLWKGRRHYESPE